MLEIAKNPFVVEGDKLLKYEKQFHFKKTI
jgi:hypothetical protein